MLDELNRCAALGIPLFIMHPGSHGGAGEVVGIERVVSRIEGVLDQYSGDTVLLIETTAGQGTGLGYRFEHIRDIIGGVRDRRIGACIDTCHIFSAGYDIRTRGALHRTMHEFDRIVGLQYVKALHLNDSRGALGARIDRHMHIGRGEIGLGAFSMIMRDRTFAFIPKILETPKKLDGRDMDRENLERLQSLTGKVRGA
jgi:deoxyribonuclease-4